MVGAIRHLQEASAERRRQARGTPEYDAAAEAEERLDEQVLELARRRNAEPLSASELDPQTSYVRELGAFRLHGTEWHSVLDVSPEGEAMTRCRDMVLRAPLEWRASQPDGSIGNEMCRRCRVLGRLP